MSRGGVAHRGAAGEEEWLGDDGIDHYRRGGSRACIEEEEELDGDPARSSGGGSRRRPSTLQADVVEDGALERRGRGRARRRGREEEEKKGIERDGGRPHLTLTSLTRGAPHPHAPRVPAGNS